MLGLTLTLLKPFNIIIIAWLILIDKAWLAAVAIIWFMISDIYDGFLFKRSSLAYNEKLFWFRRVFDTIWDRIAIAIVLIILIIHLNFPLYLYIAEIIREILLFSIWLYGYINKNPIKEPNIYSRISTFSLGLISISWLVMPYIAIWFLVPMILFGILGIKNYYAAVRSNINKH
jgi:phosphatidylglycerophosphate synthase